MISPKKYRQQIDSLGIEGMLIDVSSIDRAMNTINELDDLEKILKKVRHNLRIDIRNIRLEYLNKMKETEQQPNGLFKRKKSTEKIIKEKKILLKEKNLKIAAYEVVEDAINDYLSQIDSSRLYIKNSIQGRVG
ncbi:hypothetical protein [Methanobacterium aggregans]|uniref:hypothetical protein n=1 Tax=Methanobacterium aggregans TaxID=1615586 RepID=UPI001AE35DC2|nr:hypothetical protein [Methanobacterium aggregans]MBP2045433.1 uncharacterized membrane protein YgaE (UPF0421/DUF939 family) [Methanobacterium aggregans]